MGYDLLASMSSKPACFSRSKIRVKITSGDAVNSGSAANDSEADTGARLVKYCDDEKGLVCVKAESVSFLLPCRALVPDISLPGRLPVLKMGWFARLGPRDAASARGPVCCVIDWRLCPVGFVSNDTVDGLDIKIDGKEDTLPSLALPEVVLPNPMIPMSCQIRKAYELK